MSRIVSGLIWARSSEKNPWGAQRRAIGCKAQGLRYEKLVNQALRKAGVRFVHNPWIEFKDANGHGFCCPDFVVRLPEALVVLECKLSDKFEAQVQLHGLYIPIMQMISGQKVWGVVVTKVLRPESSSVVTTLSQAFTMKYPVLHWLGKGAFPL